MLKLTEKKEQKAQSKLLMDRLKYSIAAIQDERDLLKKAYDAGVYSDNPKNAQLIKQHIDKFSDSLSFMTVTIPEIGTFKVLDYLGVTQQIAKFTTNLQGRKGTAPEILSELYCRALDFCFSKGIKQLTDNLAGKLLKEHTKPNPGTNVATTISQQIIKDGCFSVFEPYIKVVISQSLQRILDSGAPPDVFKVILQAQQLEAVRQRIKRNTDHIKNDSSLPSMQAILDNKYLYYVGSSLQPLRIVEAAPKKEISDVPSISPKKTMAGLSSSERAILAAKVLSAKSIPTHTPIDEQHNILNMDHSAENHTTTRHTEELQRYENIQSDIQSVNRDRAMYSVTGSVTSDGALGGQCTVSSNDGRFWAGVGGDSKKRYHFSFGTNHPAVAGLLLGFFVLRELKRSLSSHNTERQIPVETPKIASTNVDDTSIPMHFTPTVVKNEHGNTLTKLLFGNHGEKVTKKRLVKIEKAISSVEKHGYYSFDNRENNASIEKDILRAVKYRLEILNKSRIFPANTSYDRDRELEYAIGDYYTALKNARDAVNTKIQKGDLSAARQLNQQAIKDFPYDQQIFIQADAALQRQQQAQQFPDNDLKAVNAGHLSLDERHAKKPCKYAYQHAKNTSQLKVKTHDFLYSVNQFSEARMTLFIVDMSSILVTQALKLAIENKWITEEKYATFAIMATQAVGAIAMMHCREQCIKYFHAIPGIPARNQEVFTTSNALSALNLALILGQGLNRTEFLTHDEAMQRNIESYIRHGSTVADAGNIWLLSGCMHGHSLNFSQLFDSNNTQAALGLTSAVLSGLRIVNRYSYEKIRREGGQLPENIASYVLEDLICLGESQKLGVVCLVVGKCLEYPEEISAIIAYVPGTAELGNFAIDLSHSAIDLASGLWATGPVAQIAITTAGVGLILYGGYKVHQHYVTKDLEAKAHNALAAANQAALARDQNSGELYDAAFSRYFALCQQSSTPTNEKICAHLLCSYRERRSDWEALYRYSSDVLGNRGPDEETYLYRAKAAFHLGDAYKQHAINDFQSALKLAKTNDVTKRINIHLHLSQLKPEDKATYTALFDLLSLAKKTKPEKEVEEIVEATKRIVLYNTQKCLQDGGTEHTELMKQQCNQLLTFCTNDADVLLARGQIKHKLMEHAQIDFESSLNYAKKPEQQYYASIALAQLHGAQGAFVKALNYMEQAKKTGEGVLESQTITEKIEALLISAIDAYTNDIMVQIDKSWSLITQKLEGVSDEVDCDFSSAREEISNLTERLENQVKTVKLQEALPHQAREIVSGYIKHQQEKQLETIAAKEIAIEKAAYQKCTSDILGYFISGVAQTFFNGAHEKSREKLAHQKAELDFLSREIQRPNTFF